MADRRLAALWSHLRPAPPATSHPPEVSTSPCAGGGSSAGTAVAAGGEEAGRENGCVFCSIVRGESPAFKLYEDEVCLCILDSNPLSFGHSLVIPKCHFSSLEVTPPVVVAAMCSKVPFLSNAIMKATQCDSFNLLVNNGSAAGQVIFHTHFHIIPRKSGDQLWPSESFRRTSIEWNQETRGLVDCIKEHLFSPSCDTCRADGPMLVKEL